MRTYIAGPRTGVVNYNREAFVTAATHLRQAGHWVLSPVELDAPEDGMTEDSDGAPLPEAVYQRGLAGCLKAMLDADLDAVVLLRGWEDSRGANLEVALARGLGWPVYLLQIVGTDSVPELVELPATVVPARHPASARYHAVIESWAVLHDRKQADYGKGNDPFANVRASEDFGIPGWIGTAVRMNDKMKRLQTAAMQYLTTGKVNLANEGLEDAFDDLGVYAGIGRVLVEEWQAAT